MSDLISRQEAIDTDGLDEEIRCEMCKNPMHTSKGCDGNCKYDERLYERIMQILDKRIKPLPSAQPEQRWIPCSERLPEAEDCPMDCLVIRKSKYIGNYTDMAVCEKNGMWTHEDWDAIVLGDVKDGKSTGLISTRDDDIIAWMPLPEPYKGGEQDD